MSHCCSQCSFTAQFQSALAMHRQLHHGADSASDWPANKLIANEKSNTVPRAGSQGPLDDKDNRGLKLGRTSSATRLLGKLRARICRSKTLLAHPEEGGREGRRERGISDLPTLSECTSKTLKSQSPSPTPMMDSFREAKQETYACHLCSFDADRITVLDRHLLTDHKIGLESLLKLVMAKTRDGLSDDAATSTIYGIRQPYYKIPDDIIEEGEFIIETVTPKIKILKHASVNTDLKGSDIAQLRGHTSIVDEEFDKLTELNSDGGKRDLLIKMKTLNECMCKFVDSSNTLKKVLTKEFEQKTSISRSERPCSDSPAFDLGLGDPGETPRGNWERAHSEKVEKSRSKYGESRSCSEKLKNTSDSFYF